MKRIKFIIIFICIPFILNSCIILSPALQIVQGANALYKGTKFLKEKFTRKKIMTNNRPYKIKNRKLISKQYYRNQFKRASHYSIGLERKKTSQNYKMAPYVVFGKRYKPMSLKQAMNYKKKGIASWYGFETSRQKNGHITANGERFYPEGLNAAHKLLPLPITVRVTNLENNKSIIVRVNDRGPFVGNRIIDLSAGAARRLGYYKKGTAYVLIKTVQI